MTESAMNVMEGLEQIRQLQYEVDEYRRAIGYLQDQLSKGCPHCHPRYRTPPEYRRIIMPPVEKEFSKRLVWFLVIVIGIIVLARGATLIWGS